MMWVDPEFDPAPRMPTLRRTRPEPLNPFLPPTPTVPTPMPVNLGPMASAFGNIFLPQLQRRSVNQFRYF